MDFPRHVRRRLCGRSYALDQECCGLFPGRDHEHPHCLGPHFDDVPTTGQGTLRTVGAGFSELAGAWTLPRPELGHRSHTHVSVGDHLSARLPGIHGWPHHDRPGPLHRHGYRLERPGLRGQRVLRRPGRLQFHLPGPFLFGLRVCLYHGAAFLARSYGRSGGHLHGADRRKCLHLPRHSFPGRCHFQSRRYYDQGKSVVRNRLHSQNQPDHPARASLYHSGDVFPQGRGDRGAAHGCRAGGGAAACLFPGHVPGLFLSVDPGPRHLRAGGDALLHRSFQQLRAGHCRGRGRFRSELGTGIRRGHRAFG